MSSRRNLANAIRALSMDAVQKANSGHPGAPMGMADIAEVLWNDHMKYNPTNANWADRDRFVLSNGHGSMLIYSLLHLTGFDLSIDDIKDFRQLHAKTAGHPEYGYIDGIETTTGPLGQGITNAVGMAIAERTLGAQFNKPGHEIVDHNTYVFMGDGCLMEGLSHESCAMAGTLGLGKLMAFWDDNDISIDGHIGDWMEKGVPGRFKSYDWHVVAVDGHDAKAINKAIEEAKAVTDKPSLICCKTTIGFGSPNLAGTHDCHGAPLGNEEIAATRKQLGWDHVAFEIPADVYEGWDHKAQGVTDESTWNDKFSTYKAEFPAEAAEFERRMAGELPANFAVEMDKFIAKTQGEMPNIASRKASQNAIEAMGPLLPEMFGGSADLTGSNLTNWSGTVKVNKENANGNYISWGVREFGMAHMMNGMVLHGGFKVYGATFFMFMEFMRNALRMSALMKIGTIYVYTHDSIGLGEDGPTHQPVEQLATMRMIPNFQTWRGCDAVESAVSWKMAMLRCDAPTALVFSRQNLTPMERTAEQVANIEKGGYVLQDCEGTPDIILIATGSEVGLAVESAAAMRDKKVRVVSMPSTDAFDTQDKAYQDSVLTPGVKRVAIEAGVGDAWYKYVGLEGDVVCMTSFGESAPADQLFKEFGFTVDNVVKTVNEVLA
ncbi:Transketolase (EC [Bathymodiolus thermophilus thioautotrophic gill symbiont]|jgi:transketolase|uniref:Transketolase n=2 Tax=sulfur-oxidizing symbionts TaxID=32036 RepID=A0A1H6KM79_9GAMM|nr:MULTISPECIES: transketolase [sulfur-oxidizing symbionts]CAC5846848.1 Transketolase (EC 2.2.1.1) [uncultured Gammaproteobacteria bacterium]CAB5497848.1 Transketolase (EC [Bathymodiolus thermophilus thioautotrophic gill symbiont]CAC9475150.1 Transketolase (EC 2.2.1.1) [uncultured Gammaproteobacteria bacterium]CAC9513767.1 Transketolase (EC 2.2.1.1) [uncultured Gammaproteobacteria bacterium]CAC9517571.1 Transketolase (EC 2.2.1.1) [uncultured Gammaproteobacteria bacterium]